MLYIFKLYLTSSLTDNQLFYFSVFLFLLTPISAYFALIVDQIIGFSPGQQSPFLKPEEKTAYVNVLFIAPLIYLSIAIFIDYLKTRVKKSKMTVNSNTLVGQHYIADPNSIERETSLAMEPRTDLPIQAMKVSKVFNSMTSGSFYALKDVSICLRNGETLGLLGPNGAGKSTLFNILSTYHDLTLGDVKMFGNDVTINSSFFKNTGICAQDEIVWNSLSVNTHLNIIRMMKGVPSDNQAEWLKLVELDRFGHNIPAQLSSGMKRKLCFLMSAISNPKYKFLDEITTGLDPMARKRTREIMTFQKKIYGASSIFTTHTMNEAEKACDRILILVNGNVCVIDTVANLKRISGGFNLTVEKNSPEQLGVEMAKELVNVFTNIPLDKFIIIEENAAKVTYDLYNVEDLPGKFDRLLELKNNGSFKDFRLNRKDLEDIFLALSRYQAPRMHTMY